MRFDFWKHFPEKYLLIIAALFRRLRTLYEKRGRKQEKSIFIFVFLCAHLFFFDFPLAPFALGLSFLVMEGGMDIIIPRWAFSSVGRALPSQGRGRRFESGKVHQIDCSPKCLRLEIAVGSVMEPFFVFGIPNPNVFCDLASFSMSYFRFLS